MIGEATCIGILFADIPAGLIHQQAIFQRANDRLLN